MRIELKKQKELLYNSICGEIMENKQEIKGEINNKTGFILGILSIATFFVCGLGIIFGISGLIFSINSYKSKKDSLGIKLSIIGIILNLMTLITLIVGILVFKDYK